jgi:hypothetical protein
MGMPRKDFTQIAFETVQKAVGAMPADQSELTPSQRASAEFGRMGGLIGGPARKKALTKKRRHEIAVKAAAARWKKQT